MSLLTHVTDAGTGLDIADATIIYTTLDGNSIGGGQTDNVGELLLEDLGFYAGEDILLTVTKEVQFFYFIYLYFFACQSLSLYH